MSILVYSSSIFSLFLHLPHLLHPFFGFCVWFFFFFFWFLVFGFWFLVFGFCLFLLFSCFCVFLFPLWSLFVSNFLSFCFFFKVFNPTPLFSLIVGLWLLFKMCVFCCHACCLWATLPPPSVPRKYLWCCWFMKIVGCVCNIWAFAVLVIQLALPTAIRAFRT